MPYLHEWERFCWDGRIDMIGEIVVEHLRGVAMFWNSCLIGLPRAISLQLLFRLCDLAVLVSRVL
jgi:hypothetical protein